ncbi:hypothetical protein HL658_18660 [Azospirillum sp. RWY-5-1]|uniref:YihY/virulence factor BrkB family protein n=1 Tax=Azospirillum oleiclasticum TaxID=2735135 RepID=A0ABX2TJN7_9PROT|nr:hypothetical protein [Azospirillum oleiclasticum]NYZ14576.1 hypothetical protein [Azospirillum oleiclasticum]NYZ24354.1 hypothetical protein [Azospirillum oleiclasticum]
MIAILKRGFYGAVFLVLPLVITSFLTFYDLTSFLSSNAAVVIQIANASLSSNNELPIILQLVVYYLNDVMRNVMWAAMAAGVFFHIYVWYRRKIYKSGFPSAAVRLRRASLVIMILALILTIVLVVLSLYPIAQTLLASGRIANSLVFPALVASITGVLGPFGSFVTELFLGLSAIIRILGFFLPKVVGLAALLLLVVFVVSYYATCLAIRPVLTPRVSAPAVSRSGPFGWLHRASALAVDLLINWLKLDALKGLEAAQIIAGIVSGRSDEATSR